MKKIGLVIFIITLSVGYIVARTFGFAGPGFNISINKKVHESGVSINEKRDVAGFDSIETSGAITVEVVSQKDFDVSVEADENILPYIKTKVDGDTLRIYREGRFSFYGNSNVVVRVAMPEVKRIDLSGASKAGITGVKEESLELQCSGASKINIAGEVSNLTADISGASNVDAEALKADKAEIGATGASKMNLSVVSYLNADASGASSITYTGEPENVEKNVSGASRVTKK